MNNKLLVIFDIDETLIHFVNKKSIKVWEDTPQSMKDNLDFAYTSTKQDEVVVFRPHLAQFFEYANKNPNLVVALWTYSEREYGLWIRDILIKKYNLPDDFFLFAYGAEDMIDEEGEEDPYPKNLQTIYQQYPDYNTFNTFIVDDLLTNINHKLSKDNCLFIQPFAPFSVSKIRNPITPESYATSLGDTILVTIENICNAILSDIEGCSEEDACDAFDSEPVFSKNRVKRMGLTQFCKTYARLVPQPIGKIMTIGDPDLRGDNIVIMSKFKGGRRKTRHLKQKKSEKTRKLKYKKRV